MLHGFCITNSRKGGNYAGPGYFSNYHSFDDNDLSDCFLITSRLLMASP